MTEHDGFIASLSPSPWISGFVGILSTTLGERRRSKERLQAVERRRGEKRAVLAGYSGAFTAAGALGLSFFISFLTVGGRNGFGVFVIPMSEEFSWDRLSTISLAASIGFLLNGLSQPFIGRLYDRIGGRKLILVSLVIIGISIT